MHPHAWKMHLAVRHESPTGTASRRILYWALCVSAMKMYFAVHLKAGTERRAEELCNRHYEYIL